MNWEKNTGPESKGYLDGGYRGLVDALQHVLDDQGVEIHCRAPVHRVDCDSSYAVLAVDGGFLAH